MTSPEPETIDSPPSRGGTFVWVILILGVGLIIYEVTHNPAWAAMGMCLKFGLEDFLTGYWLWRTDPDHRRGRACGLLYIAAGLWQVAVIGIAMVLLTVVVERIVIVQQQGPGAAGNLLSLLGGAALTIYFGFLLSAVCTWIALVYAYRLGVRPWLSSAVHFARRRQEWPPLYGHRNTILVLVITNMLVTFLLLIPTGLFLMAFIVKRLVGGKAEALVGLGMLVSVFFLLPMAIIMLSNLRRRGFFARHPVECWGEEPLPAKEPMVEPDKRIE